MDGLGLHGLNIFRMNDGAGYIWDSDRGTKSGKEYSLYLNEYVYYHMSVYAPNPPDYAFNVSWGKYVLGTTHYDEYPTESWSGYSEYAENEFADGARLQGYTVYDDVINFYNTEPNRWEDNGKHRWNNDGYGTQVCVP